MYVLTGVQDTFDACKPMPRQYSTISVFNTWENLQAGFYTLRNSYIKKIKGNKRGRITEKKGWHDKQKNN